MANKYKVMLVSVYRSTNYDDYGYDEYSHNYELTHETDGWQEVSEKDYQHLQSWIHHQPHNRASYYRLLTLHNDHIPMSIEEAVAHAKKAEEKRIAKEKKNKAAAAKRKKTTEANAKKRKLAQLEKLKQELGES